MRKSQLCLPALTLVLVLGAAGQTPIAPAAHLRARTAAVTADAKKRTAAARKAAAARSAANARRVQIWRRTTARALFRKVAALKLETARWLQLMGRRPAAAPVRTLALHTDNLDWQRWQLQVWRGREAAAQRAAQHPPHLAAWRCIHRYEASWTDDGAPYWGGLQMDMEFMATYGPELLRSKGTANHWTPLEQMWVAERAYRSGRGFSPWPNTARYCGLL